jgi:coiled-coil domain-containing protein 115
MSDQLPPTPSTQVAVEEEHPLSAQLDALLAQYLALLDTYTKLRAELQQHMSNGFFSLAQANRHAGSRLGPGRRYGEEGYDLGMKAQRTVKIVRKESRTVHEEKDRPIRELQTKENEGSVPKGGISEEEALEMVNKGVESDPPEPGAFIEPQVRDEGTHDQDHESIESTYDLTVRALDDAAKDPLKWYGILIPPALRTCQSNFTSAVSTIPSLLSTINAMRELEERIWVARREMRIINQYDYDEIETDESQRIHDREVVNQDQAPDKSELEKNLSRLSLSPPRTKTSSTKTTSFLSGSRAEPRSRVLKLD